MSLLSRKRCSRCGGILEIKTYPEGDTETKCLMCGRLDEQIVPDFVLEDKLVSGRLKGMGRQNSKGELGEIKSGDELGYGRPNKYIWHACVDCGKERWVIILKGQPKNLKCLSCSNKLNARKGRSSGLVISVR